MYNQFEPDENERGGGPAGGEAGATSEVGGFGQSGQDEKDTGVESSTLKGSPHSSSGFRRALRQQSGRSRLINNAQGHSLKPKGPHSRVFQGGVNPRGKMHGGPGGRPQGPRGMHIPDSRAGGL
jgi:hypothetical protein